MWVPHAIWFGQLVEIDLAESKRVVVLELVVFWRDELGSRLDNLLAVCQRDLGLGTVRYALNRNHTTCLPQLTDWRHLTPLK